MGRGEHRHSSGHPGPELTVILFAVIAAVLLAVEASVHVGAAIDGWRQQPPWSPLVLALDLAGGKVDWPAAATVVLVGVLLVLVAGGGTVGVMMLRRQRPAGHPDRAARLLGTGRDLAPVSLQTVRRTAERFGVAQPGLPVARAVAGGQVIYASWEDMQTDIAGPRRLKTSARAIPTILAAPGPCFATSNKPDLYAATRLTREQHGRIWTLDPEGIAGEPATWWWDPLSYVTSDRTAVELTDAFVGAYRHPDSRPDPFFDPAGQKLVANFLRAAALDGRPITDCYLWCTRPHDDTPAVILEHHGLKLAAASVLSQVHAPVEQRGGVYGTAEGILQFLSDHDTAHWVTPDGPRDPRPRLDLAAFVNSSDTLYLLSKEGKGSAAGIVTAIAMALCDAAEQLAKRSPHGRLPVPLVGVLDEAANICRWPQLPNLYSHYGSRGIVLLTLLQAWSQGAEVWGASGMEKLWGTPNIKCFGGGSDEEHYLARLEKLIGDYNRHTASTSIQHNGQGAGNRTVSWQTTTTPILTVADLRALPRDRLLVFPSGTPPVLAQPLYWWESQWADEIRQSIGRYDPAHTHQTAHAAAAGANPWIR
jgi:type IV secretory pathway TraG/TraD family ATPase VirD4